MNLHPYYARCAKIAGIAFVVYWLYKILQIFFDYILRYL